MRINSPQAPPEIQPIPYKDRPVSITELPSQALTYLADHGIHTMGQFDAAYPDEQDVAGIPYVGPTAMTKKWPVIQALRAMETTT